MSLMKIIRKEEGYKQKPYLCSAGYPTIGCGLKLGPKCTEEEMQERYQFVLSESAAIQDALDKCLVIQEQLQAHPLIRDAFEKCNMARRAILISMAYQLGVSGLAKFKKALAHMAKEQWNRSARELLDSKWAREDSPNRAGRHAWQIEFGVFNEFYV